MMTKFIARVTAVYAGLALGDFLSRYFGYLSYLGEGLWHWLLAIALVTLGLYIVELTLDNNNKSE